MIASYQPVSLIQLLLSSPADTLVNGYNIFMACSVSVIIIVKLLKALLPFYKNHLPPKDN